MAHQTHFIGDIGERVKIGAHVEITILDIRNDEVRLGIKAPPEMAINAPPKELPFFSD